MYIISLPGALYENKIPLFRSRLSRDKYKSTRICLVITFIVATTKNVKSKQCSLKIMSSWTFLFHRFDGLFPIKIKRSLFVK